MVVPDGHSSQSTDVLHATIVPASNPRADLLEGVVGQNGTVLPQKVVWFPMFSHPQQIPR